MKQVIWQNQGFEGFEGFENIKHQILEAYDNAIYVFFTCPSTKQPALVKVNAYTREFWLNATREDLKRVSIF